MTKQEATAFKKVLNNGKHYTTYFKSATGELTVKVVEVIDGYKEINPDWKALVDERLQTVIDKVAGLNRKYRFSQTMYQGFINCYDIVFE